MDKRFPGLNNLNVEEQVYVLKECLVEDYRISLNFQTNHGMFILPNKFCYSGDFQMPELLWEGVDIMRQMLRNDGERKRSGSEHQSEFSAVEASRLIETTRKNLSWTPGNSSITEQDIRDNVDKLQMGDVNSHVTVSKSDYVRRQLFTKIK